MKPLCSLPRIAAGGAKPGSSGKLTPWAGEGHVSLHTQYWTHLHFGPLKPDRQPSPPQLSFNSTHRPFKSPGLFKLSIFLFFLSFFPPLDEIVQFLSFLLVLSPTMSSRKLPSLIPIASSFEAQSLSSCNRDNARNWRLVLQSPNPS